MIFAGLRRVLSASIFIIGSIAIFGATLIVATNRAGAAAIVQAVANSMSCSTTGATPCLNVTNTSSGVAVYGTSKSGTGLRGSSTSNYGLKATSNSGEGVFGQSGSGTAGVAGTMATGTGVYGYTTGKNGIGVLGESAGTAVEGSGGIGVYGQSSAYYAMAATATNGATGLNASSQNGIAVYATTSAGSDAMYANNVSSNGNGVEASGYISLLAHSTTNSYPIVADGYDDSYTAFSVDYKGNVYYSGSLNGSADTRQGAFATVYGAKMAAPTIEDTGSAQLIAGTAAVRLDPVFAATMDGANAYRVFVTPGGDTRGLYVSSKTPEGFVVRESQGGRSSVNFDYRVVATPVGHKQDRIALAKRFVIGTGRRARR